MKELDGVESLTPNGGEEKALCREWESRVFITVLD